MAKAAKEIQMENPRELETHSTGTTCSLQEEQAEKPSMLCFKKRKKSRKKGLTVKDACEGASVVSEEKSQCVGTDRGEAKVSAQSRSSRGAWAAIKSLTRPRRRQKSSSRKKVPSDSQVQLEMDAEEGCAQGFPRKKASSGVKMPCVRFSRGKKKRSPSEAVEESEGSVQANEVAGISNKAIEEPEDLAPAEQSGRAESPSPLPAEEGQEEQGTAQDGADAGGKSEPSAEPRPDVGERAECTTQSEIDDSESVNEPAQEKLPEGSPDQTAVHVEEGEVSSEAPVSTDQPSSTPAITEVQEIASICKELPEGDESERNANLPEECKSKEATTDFSQSAFKDDAASVQSSSGHQERSETNMGTAVGIVITVTEAVDSDDTDSDQAYEPSPVLHHNKQKGNKKSSLGDQGHRTSDQYELLLIETASSLVKAAIQSSIEQLVNEMALEQNKHNSFL
ncbi:AKAP5 protein, partial [Anseranas semipalmata]|nr:AKAP5 protein [Anseranas semipalmata]